MKRIYVYLIALTAVLLGATGLYAQEPYAVLSDDNTKLTFYYDALKADRGGMSVGPFKIDDETWDPTTSWYRNRSTITTVEFAPLFVDCKSLTSTAYWFYGCEKLTTINGMAYLNTDNVVNMTSMFEGCSRLTSLDLSRFNTANVKSMKNMFAQCKSLTVLDLLSFNTANVKDMYSMFDGCSGLKTIYVGKGWSTANVEYGYSMFYNCMNLVGGQGTAYDVSNTDLSYARVDGGASAPGYLTEGAPYAVLSERNTVLTFYFDTEKAERCGLSVGPFGNKDGVPTTSWYLWRDNITTVVFDPSFANCASLTSTAYWFYKCQNLTTITGIKYLNTSNVTNMSSMFYNCSGLTSLDLSGFNTAKVTDLSAMFNGCSSLTSLDLSGFNTANVNLMNFMFYGCSSLTSLDVSGFNTEIVDVMSYMFYGCKSLTSLDLSSFNTKRMSSISYMFRSCSNLTTILVGDGWTTEDVEESNAMFGGCKSLVGEKGTAFDASHTDHTYARIDGGAAAPGYFTQAPEPYAVLSDDNTKLTFYYDNQKAARGGMSVGPFYMDDDTDIPTTSWWEHCPTITTVEFDASFAGCTSLTSTAYWFPFCAKLTTIIGIKNLKTDNVTDMTSMFAYCYSLTSLDVSGFNTQNVTDMSYMFLACTNLTSLDVSSFNTGNVTDMGSMFADCSGLTSLNLRGFDTKNVKYMSCMFEGCSALTSLDLSGLNTGNVTDMGSMFEGCFALTSLDLSGFDTKNVKYMSSMFSGCSSLTTIFVGEGWTTGKVTDGEKMFYGCESLVGGQGTAFDASHTDQTYARLDGGAAAPGYLAEKPEPYAVLSDDNTKLTFYYDIYKTVWGGMSVEPFYKDGDESMLTTNWMDHCSTITTVVFDDSFADCTSLTSTAYWFYSCTNLTTIIGIGNLNTANVTSMRSMFDYCSSLKSLDVSGFNTENVTDMRYMFGHCPSLASLDLSGFNTANVTDMTAMFRRCSGLETIIASDSWSTAKVTEGTNMFDGCTSLVGMLGTAYDASHTDHGYARIDGGAAAPGYLSVKLEPYAVLSDDNTKLTFYYDLQKAARGGMGVGPFDKEDVTTVSWYEQREDITTVVFDPSFANCKSLTSTVNWFYFCENLTTITGIEHLNTGKVTDMNYMFYNCKSLESLDLSGFNTANVEDMNHMFNSCYKLADLDLSGFNTEKVKNMSYMFARCTGLTDLNLGSFNTSGVEDMSYMFIGCSALTTIYVGDGWTTTKVDKSTAMFQGCYSLVGGQGTVYDALITNETYARIDGGAAAPGYLAEKPEPYAVLSDDGTVLTFYYDTQKTERGGMSVGPFDMEEGIVAGWWEHSSTISTVVFDDSFAGCTSLTSTALWFFNCEKLTTIIGINYLNTANVTDMTGMFFGCSSLTSLDVSGFNTAKVTSMDGMFYCCSGLTSLDVSSFNTTNVEYMSGMFAGCSGLTRLNLRGFDTKNVEDMIMMFEGCSNLTSLDLSRFNTSKVTDMSGMFFGCSALKYLDVSSFNTANVMDMNSMFSVCSALTSLDLSSFNTAKVKYMSSMFCDSPALKTIYVGAGWTTDAVTDDENMFSDCTSLVGEKGTAYSELYTDKTYARLDGGTASPGYFTAEVVVGLGDTARLHRRTPATIHDLSGRQLAAPKKGVNVVRGRKVMVK